jgi:hypothetical protein
VSDPSATPAATGNIGPEGRRQRRILGMLAIVAGTIALISLDRLDAGHAWRLTIFPLWTVAALGFLQSRARTCVVLAAAGTCDAESARVLSADDVRALRRRAVVIAVQAVVIGIGVALATLALP